MFLLQLAVLLSLFSSARPDDICIGRSVAGGHGSELVETQVPGIYGAGMQQMMRELHQGDFRRPKMVISNERADKAFPAKSDIFPELLTAAESCSKVGFGILACTACNKQPCFTGPFNCTKSIAEDIVLYSGTHDYSSSDGLIGYGYYIRAVIDGMRRYETFSLVNPQATVNQNMCKISGQNTVTLGKFGFLTVIGFFTINGGGSQTCQISEAGQQTIHTTGTMMELTGPKTFGTSCFYTCSYFEFSGKHLGEGMKAFVAMEPQIGQIPGNKAAIDSEYHPNVPMPPGMPSDGDATTGSSTLRNYMGGPPNKGVIWNSDCEMFIGSTNTTVGVVRSTTLFPESFGTCPHVISASVRIPSIPMKYATRQFIDVDSGRRQKRSLRLPNWAAGLIGGVLGGPGGAVLGMYLNGAFVTMADVDLAIDKRVGPALAQVNENFKKQNEINKDLYKYEKTIAEQVKRLADEQISLQMEMHAMSLIMSLADYTEQRATEIKAQLKAYAYSNGLKWNDATGCVTFEDGCDIPCLEQVSNITQGVITNITNTDHPDFGVVTLAPEISNMIDRNTAGLTIMSVVFGAAILVVVMILCMMCCRR